MAKKEMIEKGVKVRELFLEVENFPPTLQKFLTYSVMNYWMKK